MQIKEVINYLETIAPLSYQESYDNAGLIVGDAHTEITGVIICLDSTEAVIDEAIEKNCNLVIAHHPIVFGGLKRFNGRNYVERVVMKAIKNDIAIYAAHTNLDNVKAGVNAKICQKIGLKNISILSPKKGRLNKLYTFVPTAQSDKVRDALFEAGAGQIGNYDEASFNIVGAGTFRAKEGANPHIGDIGTRHYEAEVKIEVIFEDYKESRIVAALKASHPYEEVPYDIVRLENKNQNIGAGMIGELESPMTEKAFLLHLKNEMETPVIRHTAFRGRKVQRVAVCGGAGSFLLDHAIGKNADVFVTADYKYHQFFDAEGKIIIADIGHFESEQFTIELFYEFLTKKFTTFAVYLTEINTNPVKYI
jgi:dinuclear metal center YbgI/SA1388 family protein